MDIEHDSTIDAIAAAVTDDKQRPKQMARSGLKMADLGFDDKFHKYKNLLLESVLETKKNYPHLENLSDAQVEILVDTYRRCLLDPRKISFETWAKAINIDDYLTHPEFFEKKYHHSLVLKKDCLDASYHN